MKERRYDLYGDVKCRMCLEKNEDDDHIIYCQQLRDKWLMDTLQLLLWNKKFFAHITDSNQELSIPFIHLILKNFFLKEKYREIKLIVKIIWQSRCNLIIEWKRTKGIKKQDLRKKISAHQRITYERIPTQQIEGTSKKF
ncbi:hypothetical protein RhiirA5_432606 [Rhizophagus irregularis]|uniref:Uncharacterized protein n=1 Tax=Rhizophagus irregularis TaxID=588596 RepID=A0A2N0NT17_9GLOM|nr:hypothetical protein RhiirA5_432606 [Rhizophagus irregularis]